MGKIDLIIKIVKEIIKVITFKKISFKSTCCETSCTLNKDSLPSSPTETETTTNLENLTDGDNNQ